MHFDWSTFALQTVNFAILVWLLHRFLYRPVLRLIDARRAEIDKQYAEARSAEAKAKEQLAAVEAEHAGIAAERAAALKDAAAEAEAAEAARRVRAEGEAAALLDAARKALAVEREHALAAARRAALDLGMGLARRLLAEIPTKLLAEAWIEHIEQYLAGLPKPEVDALARQLPDGVHLTVVTASALPADAAQNWCFRLQRALGDRTAVEFAVEPKLVAGAELHFPTTVVRFSWQSALDAMRTEIEAASVAEPIRHLPKSSSPGSTRGSPRDGRVKPGHDG
jgi:F-type H+-transporting ATPase subunit b